jgi:hypothetical protein
MALFPLGILSAAGAGGVQGDYELIETAILGSSQTSVIFSNLGNFSSTYKHLQVRFVARTDRETFSQDNLRMFINGITTNTTYDTHYLRGDGSSVVSAADVGDDTNSNALAMLTGSGSQTGAFAAGVIDILDSYSTTKNKTIRTLSGQESQNAGGFGGRFVSLSSTLFNSTASITSLTFDQRFSTNFIAGSRFSLYGIRG